MLVGDTGLAEGQTGMVAGFLGNSNETVTLVCRLQIGDAVLYAQAYESVGIGDGSKGKVGKGEIHPTLTHASRIEVALLYRYLGTGIALTHLGELYAILAGETVALSEYFFES